MAGRPRKPTAKHKLEGTRPGATTRHDRGAEPGGEPLGLPPKTLKNTKHEKPLDCWREIVASVQPGVLLESDRFVVEMAARLLARTRTGLASSADYGNLIRILASLGMNPADRSRVGIAPPGKEAPPTSRFGQLRAMQGGKK